MMKRKLLLLSVFMLMGTCAFAQDFTATWEKYPAPTFASSLPDMDTEFYMWNVGYGAFYTHHRGSAVTPYWGTRASVNDTIGALVKFSQTNPDADEVNDDLNSTDYPSTFYLLSEVETDYVDDGYYCTFVSYDDDSYAVWDGVWTDNNGEQYIYFDVEDLGSGTFRFKPNSTLALAGATTYDEALAESYLGAMDDGLVYMWDPDTMGTLGYTTDDIYTVWAVVSTDTYDTYIEEAKETNKLYVAAQDLKNRIQDAYDDNPGIDLSDLIAVYNNTSSTLEELEEAYDAVSDAIVDYLKSQGSVDDPVEMTSALTNPDFSTGDYTGWSYDTDLTEPTVDSDYLNCEEYNTTFNVYQEISNLPEGVYRVDIQAFYRAGDADNDYTTYIADSTAYNYALLYAESAILGTQKKSVKRAVSERQDYPLLYDNSDGTSSGSWPYDSPLDDGTYIPNSMQGSELWFDAGYYWNNLYLGISEDDTLLVGFKKETTISSDWCIFDNFRVFYYGDEDEAYQLWSAQVLSNLDGYDLTSTYHGAPEAEAYDELKTTLGSGSTKAEILAAITSVSDVEDDLDASISNYATYVTLCSTIATWLDENSTNAAYNMECDEVYSLTEYIESSADESAELAEEWGWPNGNMKYILGYDDNENPTYEGILSYEEIAEETTYLQSLYSAAVSAALQEGGDVTSILTNADYSTGDLTGWTYDTDYGTPAVGSYVCEMWNNNFDIYQEVEGLPEGVYQLELQAFYRQGGYDDAYELWAADEEEISTFMYLNDYEKAVVSIFSDQQESDIFEDSTIPSSGSYYIPNSMAGAANGFDEGLYNNSLYGLVDEDGYLKVGIKDLDYTAYGWAIWDNFQITYWGKDAEKVALFLDELLETALDLLSETMGAPELATLEEAYDAAEAAKEAGDGDTMYEYLLIINEAITLAQSSIAAYEDLYDTYDELIEAIEDYAATASDDALEAANTLYDEVEEAIGSLELSIEEVEALIEEVDYAIAALKVPAYDSATDDDPIDFTSCIINADFSEGDDTGWEGDPTVSSSYYNAECYNTTFDVYQDIRALPAGMYEVRVNAYHRVGTYSNDMTLYKTDPDDEGDYLTAFFYAVCDDDTVSVKVMHMSVGALTSDDYDTDCSTTYGGTTYYVPNTMEDGELYMHATDDNGDYLNTYQHSLFKSIANDGSTLRIGIKADEVVSTAWILYDDFELWYYGTSSSLEESDNAVGIGNVESSSNVKTVVGIYSLSGARLSTYQQGVNIVRMVDADGNVSAMKVLVK